MIRKLLILLGPGLSIVAFMAICNGLYPNYSSQSSPAPVISSEINRLALEAWEKDHLCPGKDFKYNWYEIGERIGAWKERFRERGMIVDEKAFDAAYTNWAESSERSLASLPAYYR